MTPTISSTTKRTQLPAEVLQLEGTFIQGRGSSAMIKISHSMTSDCLGGQPWPPPDRDVLWAVVRRAGATPRPQLLKSGNCDRAAVVTTALLHIILSSSTPRSGLRQHVEELLRDEFADVERQAAVDRTNVDA